MFHQGDCLKPDTYPKDLIEYDAIIHTVGTLLEGVDYKSILAGGIESVIRGKVNPLTVLSQIANNSKPKYDESHEAINRDACKMIAEHFNNACK